MTQIPLPVYDDWVLGPVEPTFPDRTWRMATTTDVECPRCGIPIAVPTSLYATTAGDDEMTLYSMSAAEVRHDCTEALALVGDAEYDPAMEDNSDLTIVQVTDDTEPEQVAP